MMAALSESFVSSVRSHFRDLFSAFGFAEVDSRADLNGGIVVAKNDEHYVSVSCDPRDCWVSASLGRLTEGVVPPPPIAPPTSAETVREIPSAIVVWLATGDRDAAFSLGTYDEETPGAVDDAVRRTATALTTYGSRLLAGDEDEWKRAAALTVSRKWLPQ